MANFLNVLISNKYSYGATISVYYPTNDTVTQSGRSQRIALWSKPKYRYTISYDQRRENEINDLQNLYLETFGSAIPFLFEDVTNNTVTTTTGIANEDGKLKGKPFFRLFKTNKGALNDIGTTTRIFKPAPDSVKIYDNGVLKNWVIDYVTGTVALPIISRSKIVAITKEYQAKITVKTPHTFIPNDKIFFNDIKGMTQLNNLVGTIIEVVDDLNFKVNLNTINYSNFVNVNDFSFAEKYNTGNEKITWEGKFYIPVHFLDETFSKTIDGFNSATTTFTLEEEFLEEKNEEKLDA